MDLLGPAFFSPARNNPVRGEDKAIGGLQRSVASTPEYSAPDVMAVLKVALAAVSTSSSRFGGGSKVDCRVARFNSS